MHTPSSVSITQSPGDSSRGSGLGEGAHNVIVLGIILILLAWLVPGIPSIISTIGIILLVIGLVLLVLGRTGHAVGGRSNWF